MDNLGKKVDIIFGKMEYCLYFCRIIGYYYCLRTTVYDMCHAEMVAGDLYKTMNLDSIGEDVKRHLMILLLSNLKISQNQPESIVVPQSLDEAMKLGAVELEVARKGLHNYVDGLVNDFDLK